MARTAQLAEQLHRLRALRRERLVRTALEGLRDDGCLILVEKVLGKSSTFNRLFIEHDYDYKRSNGYSDLEIAQKRKALENVLVPDRLEENRELLLDQGFREVDVFFKWYNFSAMMSGTSSASPGSRSRCRSSCCSRAPISPPGDSRRAGGSGAAGARLPASA